MYGIRADLLASLLEARQVQVAYRALRTGALRRQVLTDLAVQTGWLWQAVANPELVALAGAALPARRPHWPFEERTGLVEACDRRALVLEAAALRLEWAEAGVSRGRVRGWAGRGGGYGKAGRAVDASVLVGLGLGGCA